MNNMRIRPMATKAEYEAYLQSVWQKLTLGGQASFGQLQQFIEQNTDKIVIDRNNRTIKHLGQFDVVVSEMHRINEQSLLNDRDFYFKNGLPPIEYVNM